MANFEPKQLVSNEINNGEKYRNKVDSPQADAFNKLVEAILYAQQNGVKITIDTELSSTSENAVQNKVINEALEGKLDRKPQNSSTWAYAETPDGIKMIKVSYHQPQASCIVAFASTSLGNDKPNQKGTLILDVPTRPYQVANKKYADTTYTHAITFLYNNGNGYVVYIQSPRKEPFTLQEIQNLVVLDEYGIPAYSIDYNAQYIGTMTPTQYRGYSYSDEYGEEYYFGIGGNYVQFQPEEIRDRVL